MTENIVRDPFKFEVNGFERKRISVLVICISLVLSFGGYVFIFAFPALIFILFPILYKKLRINRFASWLALKLSSKKAGHLSYIPGVNIRGRWFIEENSEKKQLDSREKIWEFFKDNITDILLVPVGIIILFFRISIAIGLLKVNTEVETSFDFILSAGGGTYLFSILVLLPVFFAFYFPLIRIWEDAEIKIGYWEESSKGKTLEITEMFFASKSIRNLILLVTGFPAIVWLINLENQIAPEYGTFANSFFVFMVIILTMAFTGGVTFLQAIMYYRSGYHQEFVNELRNRIASEVEVKDQRDVEDGIGIYKSQIIEFGHPKSS